MESETNLGPRGQPTMAHMSGLLLNAVFMDAIEMDIQRMLRINEVLELATTHDHWKPIKIVQVSPSEDIGAVAEQYYKNIPRVVRYLMKGLGDQGSVEEIASYLLFDTSFCSRLIEMGYNDAFRMRSKIEETMK
jgi:NTE family protein